MSVNESTFEINEHESDDSIIEELTVCEDINSDNKNSEIGTEDFAFTDDMSSLPDDDMELVIDKFIKEISGIKKISKQIINELGKQDKDEFESFLSSLKELNSLLKNEMDSNSIILNKSKTMLRLSTMLKDTPSRRVHVICKSFYFYLFSEYDSFIGDFLKAIYLKKPELLEESDRNFSAKQIFLYDSISDFRDAVIDKEIETFKRESYISQFSIMEKKFSLNLCKFDNWKVFVEMGQRRNILMHASGKVSDQYIKSCYECGHRVDNIIPGDILDVTSEYLLESIDIIQEVSIKLAHTVWRKLFPSELEIADKSLTALVYDLMISEDWKMAKTISEFACNQNKTYDMENKLLFTVNHCITLKELDQMDEVNRIISDIDVSALNDEFKIAFSILSDKHEDTFSKLRSLGDKGKYFTMNAYVQFPIFRFIREVDEFKEIFHEVFNEHFDEYRAIQLVNELEITN